MKSKERLELKNSVYYNIATQVSRLSTCVSKQVGCVIVSDQGRPVSWGYNGTLAGEIHCCDIFDTDDSNYSRAKHSKWSSLHEIHAEMNAIKNACDAGKQSLLINSQIICTLEPCTECTKTLLLYGIKYIYFIDEYDRVTQKEREEKYELIKKRNAFFKQIKADGTTRNIFN